MPDPGESGLSSKNPLLAGLKVPDVLAFPSVPLKDTNGGETERCPPLIAGLAIPKG